MNKEDPDDFDMFENFMENTFGIYNFFLYFEQESLCNFLLYINRIVTITHKSSKNLDKGPQNQLCKMF